MVWSKRTALVTSKLSSIRLTILTKFQDMWIRLNIPSWWLHRLWSPDNIISQNSSYRGSAGTPNHLFHMDLWWIEAHESPVSLWSCLDVVHQCFPVWGQWDSPHFDLRLAGFRTSLQIDPSLCSSQLKDTSSASSSYFIDSSSWALLHLGFKHLVSAIHLLVFY